MNTILPKEDFFKFVLFIKIEKVYSIWHIWRMARLDEVVVLGEPKARVKSSHKHLKYIHPTPTKK